MISLIKTTFYCSIIFLFSACASSEIKTYEYYQYDEKNDRFLLFRINEPFTPSEIKKLGLYTELPEKMPARNQKPVDSTNKTNCKKSTPASQNKESNIVNTPQEYEK